MNKELMIKIFKLLNHLNDRDNLYETNYDYTNDNENLTIIARLADLESSINDLED